MADLPESWVHLTLPTIERKPKKIFKVDGFQVAMPLTPGQLQDLGTIHSLIKSGGDLSPYYRRSSDRKGDRLLAERGIMHLHLGGPGSDALLYLVQYPEEVLLLRVDTHVHLDDIPPGKKMPSHQIELFAGRLKDDYEQRSAAIKASLKKFLRPKRE